MALYCHLCLLLQNHRDNSYLQQHAGTYMYVSVATVEDVSRWGGGGGGGGAPIGYRTQFPSTKHLLVKGKKNFFGWAKK